MKYIFKNKLLVISLVTILVFFLFYPDNTFARSLTDIVRDQTSAVRQFWNFWLSVANYILVAALIVMAFGTVLRIDAYSVRKLLPSILTAFILANASLLIIGIIFDISAILTNAIWNLTDTGVADEFAKIYATWGDGFLNKASGVIDAIFHFVANLIAGGLFYIIYAALWLIFFIRHWILQVYIGFAPIAFMSMALPTTRGIYQRWASGFFSWVVTKPVAIAVLALGKLIINSGVGEGAGPIGPFFIFTIGIITMLAAILAPFTVKGIGASMMAQLGGIVRGFGTSTVRGAASGATNAAKTGARSGLASVAERGGRIGAIAGGIQAALGRGAVKQQLGAEKERRLALGEQRAAALRMGQPRIARSAEERLIGQTRQDLQGINFDAMKLTDKNQLLAATEIVKEQYWRQPEYNQALAKTIASDKVLQKRLGYEFKEGLSPEEVEKEIAKKLTDGAEQGIAIAALSGGYDFETGKVTDEATLIRLQSQSSAKFEAGRINEAVMLSDDGRILKDKIDTQDPTNSTYERTERIVKVLENKPQQISNAIKASGGLGTVDENGNAKELHPWVAKLAEKGQINDAVLKGLDGMGQDVAENIGKHIGKLEQRVRATAQVPARDSSGKVIIENGEPKMTSAIYQDFNINAPITTRDQGPARALKLLQVAASQGTTAMNQAMIPVPPVSEAVLNQTQASEKLVKTLEELNKRMSASTPRVERSISSGGLVERIQQQSGAKSQSSNEPKFGQQQQQPPNPEV